MMRPAFHPGRTPALLSAGVVAIAIGLVPATADAAVVSVTGGTVAYTTAPDETNKLTVAPWGLALKLTDAGTKGKRATAIPVTAGSGCWQVSTSSVACSANVTHLNADLGDGADSFDATLATTAVTVEGGAGNDVLHGGIAPDTLDGGAGNDTIDARDAASDTLVCGDGTDGGNADTGDTVASDCESVARPATIAPPELNPPGLPDPTSDPAGPGTDPTTVPVADPTPEGPGSDRGEDGEGLDPSVTPAANSVPASIPPQTVGVSASGVANVRVVCPADSGGCSGTVAIRLPAPGSVKAPGRAKASGTRAAGASLGQAKFKAAAGTAPVVPVKLSKRGRQRIIRGRGRRSRVQIVVTTRKADGSTSVTSQDAAIRLKRAPAKRRAGRR
jgi:hypothetical protein